METEIKYSKNIFTLSDRHTSVDVELTKQQEFSFVSFKPMCNNVFRVINISTFSLNLARICCNCAQGRFSRLRTPIIGYIFANSFYLLIFSFLYIASLQVVSLIFFFILFFVYLYRWTHC